MKIEKANGEQHPRVTTQVRTEWRAADRKHGMTLDELARFVDAARRLEIPGGSVIHCVATWRSSIKSVSVEGDR